MIHNVSPMQSMCICTFLHILFNHPLGYGNVVKRHKCYSWSERRKISALSRFPLVEHEAPRNTKPHRARIKTHWCRRRALIFGLASTLKNLEPSLSLYYAACPHTSRRDTYARSLIARLLSRRLRSLKQTTARPHCSLTPLDLILLVKNCLKSEQSTNNTEIIKRLFTDI